MRPVLAALILACLAGSAFGADAAPRYEDFAKSIKGYPYKAAEPRAAQIRRGAAGLSRCLKKAQALQALGAPDFARDIFDEQGERRRRIGSMWTYYLSKRSAATDENDVQVVVWFDAKDKIDAIFMRGVPRPDGGKNAHLKKCS